jgi:myo-inositol-1(or 4)-monophosphatase
MAALADWPKLRIGALPRALGPLVAERASVLVSSDELLRCEQIALRIAGEVRGLLLEGYRKASAVREKGTSDLVTEHDERCEARVKALLAELAPDHGLVGEEGSASGGHGRLVWHVDPIDGTTNFAHGHPFFCFSMGLALREDGRAETDRAVYGLVLAPALGLTWSGGPGIGVRRNGEPCRVSATDRLERALCGTGFPASRMRDPDNNYERFLRLDAATHGVRRCGAAALEIALVADGAYDAFWDLGLKSWDVCAGAALVEGAGGRSGCLDGSPLVLGAREVVFSNGALFEPLRAALDGGAPLPPLTPALGRALKTVGPLG